MGSGRAWSGGRKREIRSCRTRSCCAATGWPRATWCQALQRAEPGRPGRPHAGARRGARRAASPPRRAAWRSCATSSSPAPAARRCGCATWREVVDGPAEARSGAKLGDGRSAVGLVVRKQSGVEHRAGGRALVKESLRAAQEPAARRAQGGDGRRRRQVHPLVHRRGAGGHGARRHPRRASSCCCSCATGAPRSWRRWRCPTSVIGTFAVMPALRLHLQHDHDAGADALHRPAHRRRHRGIENIVRHLEEGEPPCEAALQGHRRDRARGARGDAGHRGGVRPGGLHGRHDGQFFYQFGVTVAVAVLISYGVSMTLTPDALGAHAARSTARPAGVSRAIERVLAGIESGYRRALGAMLVATGCSPWCAAVGVLVAHRLHGAASSSSPSSPART